MRTFALAKDENTTEMSNIFYHDWFIVQRWISWFSIEFHIEFF